MGVQLAPFIFDAGFGRGDLSTTVDHHADRAQRAGLVGGRPHDAHAEFGRSVRASGWQRTLSRHETAQFTQPFDIGE